MPRARAGRVTWNTFSTIGLHNAREQRVQRWVAAGVPTPGGTTH
jgi:hypothetical protein